MRKNYFSGATEGQFVLEEKKDQPFTLVSQNWELEQLFLPRAVVPSVPSFYD